MAFYSEKDEDEIEEGSGATLSPSSGVVAPGAAAQGAGAAPSTASAPKPESFVGISQYINANKPQSEKLANQVVGKIDEKVGAVDNTLSSAKNSFNETAESQKVAIDEALLKGVRSNAEKIVSDPNKVSSFTKLRDASYKGPKNLQELNQGQSWAGIQDALTKARQAKDATNTEAGRMGLIKEISNNPRQSQGALTFDNLLLQSNPNAAGKLQAAGSGLQTIDERLKGANEGAALKAREISDLNKKTSETAKGALKDGYSGLEKDLLRREKAADFLQMREVENLRQAIQKGDLTPEQLKQLKMKGDEKTYGVDLSNFIKYQDGIDKYSVAKDEDVLRQKALKELAGEMDLGQDILSGARKLGEKGAGFAKDTAGYQKDLKGAMSRYDAAVNSMPKKGTPEWNTRFQGPVPESAGGGNSLYFHAGTPLEKQIENYAQLAKEDRAYEPLLNHLLNERKKLQEKYRANETLMRPSSSKIKTLQG